MTRRTVPARTEVVCDRCGVACNHDNRNYTQQGRFLLSTAFSGPIEYDLCDTCLKKTNDELGHIMKGTPE